MKLIHLHCHVFHVPCSISWRLIISNRISFWKIFWYKLCITYVDWNGNIIRIVHYTIQNVYTCAWLLLSKSQFINQQKHFISNPFSTCQMSNRFVVILRELMKGVKMIYPVTIAKCHRFAKKEMKLIIVQRMETKRQ